MATPLIELVENLPRAKVVLVGDLMLDRYIFGSTERVSPEAPVPVVHFQREEFRLGGAGFVLANLASLGASVDIIGVIGQDEAGAEVRRRVGEFCEDSSGLIETSDRPTVMKVRLLGASQDRTPHQMLRLDFENAAPMNGALAEKIIARTEAALDGAAMLCLEDYNKGVLTPDVCQRLIQLAKARNIPVIIDPANIADYSKYRGATALKLNRPETERSTGLPARQPSHYQPAAERLLGMLDLEAVVITLNELGSYLATRQGEREWLHTRPRAVADGTGAGDTLLAGLCMARAAGASWRESVTLANIAAGLEVERLGCVPITPQEIVQDLLLEVHEHLGKERRIEQLLPELDRHRAAGKRIVFTNGCFDIVHLGHVKYFQRAKAQGDLLVVGVNTDAGIRRLKGDKRPVIQEDDRVGVLEELESIDYLVRFDEDTPIDLITRINPDVLVKGADFQKEQVVGWDIVESCGGKVALAPLIDGRSTSNVIQRILEAYR
jgi:D-beta-D-heptose 7-phosphate kinase/D-beta-D-heptose 1-phosphate adenosyltransferase